VPYPDSSMAACSTDFSIDCIIIPEKMFIILIANI
jgi:hypothetical protein